MSHELFYTSAPRGLKPGSNGFCTVAMTRGLPAALVDRLEWLSGYRPLFPAGNVRAAENPISFAHWRVTIGRQAANVLSRVCFAGLDHTQRSNKFAHHLVLGPDELPAAGPAWLLQQSGVMETAWGDGDAVELEAGRPIPMGDSPAAPCRAWAAATGDAGWAGVLVDAFLADPTKAAYIFYRPGVDVLELLGEAIALLPESRRWQATFNTYFTDLPAGLACAWRCCVAGTPVAKEAARSSATTGSLIIDLTSAMAAAPDTAYAHYARTGVLEESARAPVRSFAFPPDEETAAPDPRKENGNALVEDPQPAAAADAVWQEPIGRGFTPERLQRRPRKVAGARWPFWVIALLWPLAIGALAWNNLQRHPNAAAPAASPATATSEDRAALAAEVARLQRQAVELTNKLESEKRAEFDRGRVAGSQDPPDPRLWVRKTEQSATTPAPSHSEEDYRKLVAQLEQARQSLAAATPAAPAVPAGHLVRDDAGHVLSQWVTLPEVPQKTGAPAEAVLATWPGGKPSKLVLAIPNATGSVYKQKTASDGAVTLYRPSGSGLSGDVDRARFHLADGKLMFQWLIDEKDDKEIRAVTTLLLFATARVSDDANALLNVVQFMEPERCDLFLSQRKVGFRKAMPSMPVGTLQLALLARAANFTALEGGNSASITFRGHSGDSFTIDADSRGVTTTWAEVLIDAANQKAQSETEVDRLRQPLPKLKKNEIDNGRRKDDAYKAAFAAYDLSVEKARQQAAVYADLNRPFRCTLACLLPNGAVVATIEVSKDPPKPE